MIAVGLLALAAAAGATPLQPQQVVFGALGSAASYDGLPKIPHTKFNPLDHMSGIAPYHDAPGADIRPPPRCQVAAAAFLIRHSSIYANDDEYDDYMKPFIERVEDAQHRGVGVPSSSPLSFLAHWRSKVNESNLEDITEPGKEDAYQFGRRFRRLYGPLMPPKHLGRGKKGKGRFGKKGKKEGEGKVKTPFKVWSASSERDIETSKAWVRGAFPYWQNGKDGEGDGDNVQLIAVKNKDADWANSLTPHKICDAFTKEAGKPEAQQWLETYGPPILDRLNSYAPGFGFELNDVIAMQMLCGYETVITKSRSSPFCSSDLFKPDDFRAFGYFNDIKYHHIVGYGSPVAPYLGVQWLNTSTHNLLAAYAPDPHTNATALSTTPSLFSRLSTILGGTPKLPPPSNPPDATHTQLLYVYFTHREEPPLALTALGLWNTTTESLPPTAMPKDRKWKTSHLLPFLGHIAIERLHCEPEEFAPLENDGGADGPKPTHPRKDYVRVLVNGAPQQLPSCHDGPGGTCLLTDFEEFVKARTEEFKDFEGACKKKDGGEE